MNKKKLIETIAKYFASYIGTIAGFWILYWVISWSLYGIANASHSGSMMHWLAKRNYFDVAERAEGAIYLNERDYWKKEEMNSMPYLVGLFDELNKFDLDNLKKRESLIKRSPILEEIVSVLTNVPMASFRPSFTQLDCIDSGIYLYIIRSTDGIRYLGKRKKWIKEEMDTIPCLVGLFDELNNFDIANLKKREALIKGSSILEGIVSALTNVPMGSLKPPFTKLDYIDSGIYLYTIRGTDKGIRYLGKRKKWIKEGMDTIPCLVGLFDELNNFDIANLKKRESLIKSSPILEEIVSALTNVPKGSLKPPFTQLDYIDSKIYLYTIRGADKWIRYLKREIWRKEEMDSIPRLGRLFDELNNFDLANLKKRELLIKSSPILEEIVSALTKVPKRSLKPPFSRKGYIDTRLYLYKIEQASISEDKSVQILLQEESKMND